MERFIKIPLDAISAENLDVFTQRNRAPDHQDTWYELSAPDGGNLPEGFLQHAHHVDTKRLGSEWQHARRVQVWVWFNPTQQEESDACCLLVKTEANKRRLVDRGYIA